MGVTEAMERQAVDFSEVLLLFGCVNDVRTVWACLQRYREVAENKDNAVPAERRLFVYFSSARGAWRTTPCRVRRTETRTRRR